MAMHLGISRNDIVDPWAPQYPITPGALHVTNAMPDVVPPGVTAIYSV